MADSVVNLGQGSYQDFSDMSMDEMLFGAPGGLDTLRRTRPSYSETGEAYRFVGDEAVPFIDEEGYRVTLDSDERSYYTRAIDGLGERQERADPYAGHAGPMFNMDMKEALLRMANKGSLFLGNSMEGKDGVYVPRRLELTSDGTLIDEPVGFDDGGAVPMPEEAGILSALFNKPSSEELELIRKSGRMDSPVAETYYPQGDTFMEQLIEDYGYPAQIPRQDEEGFPVVNEQGGQQMMIATDFNLPESVRARRPRPDFPTYGELEDARAHALGTLLMSKEFGPMTALKMGSANEFFSFASSADAAMDRRNNAVGAMLLTKAGVDVTPDQAARLVDREIFNQLDVIMGRTPEEQKTPAAGQPDAPANFGNPDSGISVYFPRHEDGTFDLGGFGYY